MHLQILASSNMVGRNKYQAKESGKKNTMIILDFNDSKHEFKG